MKNKFLLRIIQVIGAIAALFVCLWLVEVVTAFLDSGPTAIVVDAETGKPVESAVALAQWFRAAGGSVAEGGSEALDKAAEAFSDKDGKIYIDDFWGIHILTRDPRLTVYKPGYVIWDSKEICPSFQEKRTDFDKAHRIVKLLKFDTEAARWLKEKYDEGRGGPRRMQGSFFNHCYSGEMGMKYHGQIKFQKIFDDYEIPMQDREGFERSQKLKQK
jgi:hypothetical protein